MNRKASLILLTPLALLVSCATPESSNGRYYDEPTEGTYDPNRRFKETEPVDLVSLGLEKDIDDLITEPLTPWRGRTDGSLDPYLGIKPNQAPRGALPTEGGYDNRHCDYPASLFDKSLICKRVVIFPSRHNLPAQEGWASMTLPGECGRLTWRSWHAPSEEMTATHMKEEETRPRFSSLRQFSRSGKKDKGEDETLIEATVLEWYEQKHRKPSPTSMTKWRSSCRPIPATTGPAYRIG